MDKRKEEKDVENSLGSFNIDNANFPPTRAWRCLILTSSLPRSLFRRSRRILICNFSPIIFSRRFNHLLPITEFRACFQSYERNELSKVESDRRIVECSDRDVFDSDSFEVFRFGESRREDWGQRERSVVMTVREGNATHEFRSKSYLK